MLVYDHCCEGWYMGKLIGNNIFNLKFKNNNIFNCKFPVALKKG
jgi:hypothetical protein